MKTTIRNIQLWIHRHYDGVKLTLAIVTLFILVIGLLLQNQVLLRQSENTEKAVNETQQTTEQLKRFTQSVAGAVDELKEDNKRQTIILCTIILRGNLELSAEDAQSIQQICEQEVERALEEEPSLQDTSLLEDNNRSQSVNPTRPIQPSPQPAPEEQPGPILQPAIPPESPICQLLSLPILNIIKGIAC